MKVFFFFEDSRVRTVAVETQLGNKFIFNVYFVLKANQNQFSVGQLTESQYALLFKDKYCIIFDPKGDKVLTVEMKNKCYPIDWKLLITRLISVLQLILNYGTRD